MKPVSGAVLVDDQQTGKQSIEAPSAVEAVEFEAFIGRLPSWGDVRRRTTKAATVSDGASHAPEMHYHWQKG